MGLFLSTAYAKKFRIWPLRVSHKYVLNDAFTFTEAMEQVVQGVRSGKFSPQSGCTIFQTPEFPLLRPNVTILKINNCHPGWWVKVNLNGKPTPTKGKKRARNRERRKLEEEDEGKREKTENSPWTTVWKCPQDGHCAPLWAVFGCGPHAVNHSLPKRSDDFKLHNRAALIHLEAVKRGRTTWRFLGCYHRCIGRISVTLLNSPPSDLHFQLPLSPQGSVSRAHYAACLKVGTWAKLWTMVAEKKRQRIHPPAPACQLLCLPPTPTPTPTPQPPWSHIGACTALVPMVVAPIISRPRFPTSLCLFFFFGPFQKCF